MSLYTKNKRSAKEIKKILFIIASARIKLLRENLSKEEKVLNSENYKILLEEIKELRNKWKGSVFVG